MKTDNAAERLIHYSAKPLREVRSVALADQEDHFKPKGLWVSVEGPDDWKSWCEAEGFSLANLSNPHQIVLAESAKILRVSSAAEIDELTDHYALGAFPAGYKSTYRMDWKSLVATCDGIIIAPYIWGRRLDGGADWYYSWDCASGCIWNATAIAEIIPLAVAAATEEAAHA